MAFDACMVAAITDELNKFVLNARVEKVQQPEKDELVFVLHSGRDTLRLSISAGANSPRINLTSLIKENPIQAPMFCMLLRKHLVGGKLTAIRQTGFERAIELEFESCDELGFEAKKYLIAEIMGKYSNIIFCDKDKKIISAINLVDFTTSQKRQVLPGMLYEAPPKQDKLQPLEVSDEDFIELRRKQPELPQDKFISNNFMGISTLTARETAYRAKGSDVLLLEEFKKLVNRVKTCDFTPIMLKNADGTPLEYSFMPIYQYGSAASTVEFPSFGALIDEYFGERERADRIKQRGNDILKLLSNIEARLKKKIDLQRGDLRECASKDTQKLYGDLITANIYRLKRGMESATLENYYSEAGETVEIPLDSRMTPAQNAQRYYKKYAKAKAAEAELTHQLALAGAELDYIYTVFDAAVKAENENDLNEIRRELYESGYASRMKDYGIRSASEKKKTGKPMEFVTGGGYKLLVGKNNSQNDFVTTKAAEKTDLWFHVKNAAGSHCVLQTEGRPLAEIPDADITAAAETAAFYSSERKGQNTAVDYTFVRNVKKPGGSKPGFVIYTTNWTAYVTPDEAAIESMRKK